MTRPAPRLVEFAAEELSQGGRIAAESLALAAEVLHHGEVLALRLHPVDVAKAEAVGRVATALRAIHARLVDDWSLPKESYVEIDDESRGVPVAPFHSRRFLMPHQDGGHCSFLTPSLLDRPDLRPEERVFSSTVYWRRPSHKIFQGFVATEPGEPPGATYYYDALTMLGDAFRHQRGRAPSGVPELAGFALENLRRSRALQPTHVSRYLTLGAFLGSPEPAHHVSPSGPRGESEFWPAQYLNLPNLADLADACPRGCCDGPGVRVLCHACLWTLGTTWPEARARYETAAVARRYDLLMANNLTLYHAADSDQARTIVPMCIVTNRPEGEAYEHWLAGAWRAGRQADRFLLESVSQ